MKDISDDDVKVMEELVKELDEFNSYVREGKTPLRRPRIQDYNYAFDPSANAHDKKYKRNMKLLSATYKVLDENHINVKCLGYTHLKDAVCIVIDMKSMDSCLMKELYLLIAEKYDMNNKKGVRRVEHSIRNALHSAYRLTKEKYPDDDCLMNTFIDIPTNKAFILKITQEVGRRMFEEMSRD